MPQVGVERVERRGAGVAARRAAGAAARARRLTPRHARTHLQPVPAQSPRPAPRHLRGPLRRLTARVTKRLFRALSDAHFQPVPFPLPSTGARAVVASVCQSAPALSPPRGLLVLLVPAADFVPFVLTI